jgi:hypothetical protein
MGLTSAEGQEPECFKSTERNIFMDNEYLLNPLFCKVMWVFFLSLALSISLYNAFLELYDQLTCIIKRVASFKSSLLLRNHLQNTQTLQLN